VFIPRIPLITSNEDFPFTFKRIQFTLRLAFGMSINKSQGQSLRFVGINLENPCFSHGQVYVATSRVGSANNLFIFQTSIINLNKLHIFLIKHLFTNGEFFQKVDH
jgi:ATP-dependent DNA helicase PIF1